MNNLGTSTVPPVSSAPRAAETKRDDSSIDPMVSIPRTTLMLLATLVVACGVDNGQQPYGPDVVQSQGDAVALIDATVDTTNTEEAPAQELGTLHGPIIIADGKIRFTPVFPVDTDLPGTVDVKLVRGGEVIVEKPIIVISDGEEVITGIDGMKTGDKIKITFAGRTFILPVGNTLKP